MSRNTSTTPTTALTNTLKSPNNSSTPNTAENPVGCVLDGLLPDSKAKKSTDAHWHSTYGGSMNLGWWSRLNLSPAVQKVLSFPESCLIVSEGGDSIGKMQTSLSMSSWSEEPCMLLHSGSSAKLRPNVEVGTTITAFLRSDLSVIQEFAHEWCRYEGVLFDRKTFLMEEKTESKLNCRMTSRRDGEVKSDRSFWINAIDLSSFVSEAANIVLHRLVIQEKKTGEVFLKALTNRGNMVKVSYRLLGTGYENVKGEDVRVWGIRRTVWCENEVQCWDSLFNYYGRLVLRCQPENDKAMVPLWYKPVDEFDKLGAWSGCRPPLVWACDPELHSSFLVRKAELTGAYKTYLLDHPELRAILSDFLQKVLLAKPRNVLEFAKFFFQPFLVGRPDTEKEESLSGSSKSSDSSLDLNEGEWGGEGYWAEGGKYDYLNATSRPYSIENYFAENNDGFILQPRTMSGGSDFEVNKERAGESDGGA